MACALAAVGRSSLNPLVHMVVQAKEDLLLLIQVHQGQIKAFGVSKLGIFGSFVRGQQRDESDVDVLVEFAPGCKTFDAFIHLAFFLEDLFGRPVELVTPESLSPYIGPHILSETEYVNLGSGLRLLKVGSWACTPET